jgi:hypothetical protein
MSGIEGFHRLGNQPEGTFREPRRRDATGLTCIWHAYLYLAFCRGTGESQRNEIDQMNRILARY